MSKVALPEERFDGQSDAPSCYVIDKRGWVIFVCRFFRAGKPRGER
jgi:hypothetical protein